MRGYMRGSSPIPVYNFLTGGVLPAPGGCGCKGSCGKCAKTPRGWKRYNEIVTKRLGPGRYSILLQPGLSGLGQDDSGTVAPTIDTSYSGELIPYDIPAGYGYGPSPSGGVTAYPAGPPSYADAISGNPQPMPPTTQAYQVSSSGVIPVLVGSGVGVSAPSLASGSSLLWWLLGGAALVGVVALSGGKGRR